MTAPAAVAGARVIVLEIPGTLDKRLSPNSRTPGRTVSGLRRKLRDHVAQTARAWRNNEGFFGDEPLLDEPVWFTVRVEWEKGRHFWDQDNIVAACKGLCDGLESAGIIANDRYLIWQGVGQKRDPNGTGAIVVTLAPVYADIVQQGSKP